MTTRLQPYPQIVDLRPTIRLSLVVPAVRHNPPLPHKIRDHMRGPQRSKWLFAVAKRFNAAAAVCAMIPLISALRALQRFGVVLSR